MPILDFADDEALGKVIAVDTASVTVEVVNIEVLRGLQVNRLVVLQSSTPGQHLVGVVTKITRTPNEKAVALEADEGDAPFSSVELNLVKASLIGTLIDKDGDSENVFRRTLETVPEIDANCFNLESDRLTAFMGVIASVGHEGQRLSLGSYTLDDKADAYLNANKFFQRHAMVVGSTGSGKSWTVARLMEQAAALPNANAILFDIHGEYSNVAGAGFRHLKVAGPADLGKNTSLDDGILYLPFWLLNYEALTAIFVDRSDQNAPNQSMVMARTIVGAKKAYLEANGKTDLLENFTIDSPVPFNVADLLTKLNELNVEMIEGASGRPKQGDFHGKLARMIARFENRIGDRRLGFMFQPPDDAKNFDWLPTLAKVLVGGSSLQDSKGGVVIINFSEVPSDILPIMISLTASICFNIQQWVASENRHPIVLFCDEAHLYIPQRASDQSASDVSVQIFERIAKEGRKYGVGLTVISQRPSEVNKTVLSQCNNMLAMRLTNAEDQSVIKRLLPDSLGGFSELLPILDTGEALVVGDASLLPTRVRVRKPDNQPSSGTIPFWDEWSKPELNDHITTAVDAWRKQSMG